MKKVTIGLILFGTKYLKKSLPTLVNQDYQNIEFVFRDQEKDKWSAYELIKKELPEIAQKVKLSKEDNLFHSGGHNAIINEMDGDLYFCCSNDMLYPSDFVSKMVKAMEENPDCSFATPKILRWDYENDAKTSQIDSLGLGKTAWHHFYDIGQGEEDHQYKGEIWGTSGAMSVFSKKALESVKFVPSDGEPEYFDNFIHYKNDVDLSYRLRIAGNKPLLVQDVVVYHDRQAAKDSKKSLWVKQSSFFGEKVLMAKNFPSGGRGVMGRRDMRAARELNGVSRLWGGYGLWGRILTRIYHFLKTGFLLITTPQLFKEYKKLRKLRMAIEAKRRAIWG